MKSKRNVFFALITVLLCMSMFSACPESDDAGNNITVSFDTSQCEPDCGCSGNDPAPKVNSISIPKGRSFAAQGKALPSPERANHSFINWLRNGEIFYEDDILNSNTKLVAKWRWDNPNIGNIIFAPANGGNTTSLPGEIGLAIANFPNDPVWYGYDFLGWFDDQDKKYDKDTVLERVRMTLTARWEKNTTDYTWIFVKFNTNGGEPKNIDPVEIPSGGTLGLDFPANPTNDDPENEFLGWFVGLHKYDKDTIIESDVDITLIAKWIKWGEQEDGTYLVNHTKFAGGSNASFTNNDTVTFTSQWGNRQYNISDMGGLDAMSKYKYFIMFFSLTPGNNPLGNVPYQPPFSLRINANETVHQSVSYTNPGNNVLVITEENFQKIKDTAGVTRLEFVLGSTSTFSMKISSMLMTNELPEVTVTFDPGAYGTLSEVKLTAGAAIGEDNIPADPVRPGYFFNGWIDSITHYPVHENIRPGTLIAIPQWIQILTITFKSEGETVETKELLKGTSFDSGFPDAPSPSDSSWSFIGWCLEADTLFLDPLPDNTVFNESVTLVAGWLTPDLVATVTFDLNGGTALHTNPINVRKGRSMGTQFQTPVKPVFEGIKYNFLGWFDESVTPEVQYTATTVVAGDLTLKARWQEVLPLVTSLADNAQNDTLFNSTGTWVDSNTKQTKFEYDSKLWWIIGDTRNNPDNTGLYMDGYANPNPAFPSADWERVKAHHANGYTRLSWAFPTSVNVYNTYTYITVSYEMVVCSATPNASKNSEGIEDGTINDIEIRRALNAGGGSVIAGGTSRQILTEGESSFTRPLTGFYDGASPTNAIALVKYTPAGSMLVRITEIRFHN